MDTPAGETPRRRPFLRDGQFHELSEDPAAALRPARVCSFLWGPGTPETTRAGGVVQVESSTQPAGRPVGH